MMTSGNRTGGRQVGDAMTVPESELTEDDLKETQLLTKLHGLIPAEIRSMEEEPPLLAAFWWSLEAWLGNNLFSVAQWKDFFTGMNLWQYDVLGKTYISHNRRFALLEACIAKAERMEKEKV
mgnify:CR=1 FL=1